MKGGRDMQKHQAVPETQGRSQTNLLPNSLPEMTDTRKQRPRIIIIDISHSVFP